jgi:hypothetical protein
MDAFFALLLDSCMPDLSILDSLEDVERLGLIEPRWLQSDTYYKYCVAQLPDWKTSMSEILGTAFAGQGDPLMDARVFDDCECFYDFKRT